MSSTLVDPPRRSRTSRTPHGRSPASRIARRSSPRERSTPARAPRCSSSARTSSAQARSRFRGAYNALSRLSADERRRGVLTFSSGNHAQAVALAGQLLDIPRVIVMPADAPAVKRAPRKNTAAKSSSTIRRARRPRSDRTPDCAGTRAHARSRRTITPTSSPARARRRSSCSRNRDRSTSCSSPAAAAGCCRAAPSPRARCRRAAASSASSRRRETMRRDRSGRKQLQTVDNPQTVADGARTPSLGSLTFPLVLEYVSDMTTVDDPTLLQTMFFLWERMKLVVEPTGALGAAAALHGGLPDRGRAGRRHPDRRQRRFFRVGEWRSSLE